MHAGTRVILAAVGLLAGVAMVVGVVAAPASAADDQVSTVSTTADGTIPPAEDLDHVVEGEEPVLTEPQVEDLDYAVEVEYVVEVEEPALSVPQVDEPAVQAGAVGASEPTTSMNEAPLAPEIASAAAESDEPAEGARLATPSVLPATGAPASLVPAVAGVLLILAGLVLVRRALVDQA